jgi:hypothetical protein
LPTSAERERILALVGEAALARVLTWVATCTTLRELLASVDE